VGWRPGPGAPLFQLDGVSLAIHGATILDDVCLVVPDRGITVLLGPSGAGKSTVLRLLNRLEVPTAGEVRFRGEPVSSLDPLTLRRQVGMVFQRPAPFTGTVRDNLAVADPGAGDEAFAAALRSAGLDEGFLARSADDLSGGEAQRMCLARTLVTEPDALLMDEPTSAVDPEARHHLERTARRLADDGRPMVWVTHDLDQAARLADEVLVLIGGRVASDEERARFLAGGDPGGSHDPGALTDDEAAEGDVDPGGSHDPGALTDDEAAEGDADPASVEPGAVGSRPGDAEECSRG
jgi:putative ABC transport system ATP-binding protein